MFTSNDAYMFTANDRQHISITCQSCAARRDWAAARAAYRPRRQPPAGANGGQLGVPGWCGLCAWGGITRAR